MEQNRQKQRPQEFIVGIGQESETLQWRALLIVNGHIYRSATFPTKPEAEDEMAVYLGIMRCLYPEASIEYDSKIDFVSETVVDSQTNKPQVN